MGGNIPGGNFPGIFWGGFTVGEFDGWEFSEWEFSRGAISLELWNICKKLVNIFVFVSRGVAL